MSTILYQYKIASANVQKEVTHMPEHCMSAILYQYKIASANVQKEVTHMPEHCTLF